MVKFVNRQANTIGRIIVNQRDQYHKSIHTDRTHPSQFTIPLSLDDDVSAQSSLGVGS